MILTINLTYFLRKEIRVNIKDKFTTSSLKVKRYTLFIDTKL